MNTQGKNWKNWIVGTALVFAAAGFAAAQTPQTDADKVKSRQRISMMEGVLEKAVHNGADNLLRRVDTVMPDAVMLTGAPQARGFRLDGYGVFFDVEVPGLHVSVTWSLRAMLNDTRQAAVILAQLKARVGQLSPRERDALEPFMRQLALTLTVPPAGAPPPVAPVGPDVLDDPEAAWTREVKTALIEAMLENSGPLEVSAGEWLTVAAQDNAPRDPLVPGGTVDFSTVIFRVKGSVLEDLHARRISLEEARKLVEVREQ